MVDHLTQQDRSKNMGRIGGKDTKPEIIVRKLLHRLGYRFRIHRTDLPGKPDIVLPKYQTVVFVHGCYWHRHQECKRGNSTPSTNSEFWKEKFEKTAIRDQKNIAALQNLGWKVLIVWECETKATNILNLCEFLQSSLQLSSKHT